MLPGTIADLCNIMTNASIGKEIDRYAEVNSAELAFFKEPSLDVSYSGYISDMKETNWSAPFVAGGGKTLACWDPHVCTCMYGRFA